MENVKNYWKKGISYEQYLKDCSEKIESLGKSDTPHDKTFLHYYELGLTRMQRVGKTYKPDPKQVSAFKTQNFNGKFLVISEGWCGDAAMILPVIHQFFSKNELKIVYRDENEELIQKYLTNGGKAIPIVLILDQNENVLNHWGPRPKYGMELLASHKENPEIYTAEDFHNDLQIYYTKNKGFDIIEELLLKISIRK